MTRAPSFDAETGALLLAERLVGEILGWDLVDWSVVEPHKGRKFSFGRQQQRDPSIYGQLKPLFDRCDPEKGDFSALKPSPVVNDNLSKLVGCICSHIGKYELPNEETDAKALERTVDQDRLHLAVIERFFERIETSPDLGDRAKGLKRIAASAEGELEKHFVDLINERLEKNFLPDDIADAQKLDSLRHQAEERIGETRLLNERELDGLSVPDLALDDQALVRIEMIRILLSRFPYVRNYELMLLAELTMLQAPRRPCFVRERMLSSLSGTIDAARIQRWDSAVARVSMLFGEAGRKRWQGSFADRKMAICGSGALPMSAFLLHLLTGASFILIDSDQAAVKRSERLIANLERLDILTPGALTVCQEDAGEVCFLAPEKAGGSLSENAVVCDAVMIASLVDQDAKTSIAAQFAHDPKSPDLLIMRSATGLSAKFAYDQVPTERFSRGRLAFCGETMPATQVATHLDRAEAIGRGVACLKSKDLLAIAHPDVVNTTEIYRKISSAEEAFDLDFEASLTIDDWIRDLEHAGAKLGAARS